MQASILLIEVTLEKSPVVLRKSSVEVVVEVLRSWLIGGRLEPGARLTEMGLSADLGIGRSTVRTALLELEKDDLVVRNPYVGWSVPEITPTAIWELYTLRGALEELAARLVAQKIDDQKRKMLNDAFSMLEQAERGDPGSDRTDADLNFHRTIVQLSGHSRLIQQYNTLLHKMEWAYRWSERQSPKRINLAEWHRPILHAISSGKASVAERWIRDNYKASVDADIQEMEQSPESRTTDQA